MTRRTQEEEEKTSWCMQYIRMAHATTPKPRKLATEDPLRKGKSYFAVLSGV